MDNLLYFPTGPVYSNPKLDQAQEEVNRLKKPAYMLVSYLCNQPLQYNPFPGRLEILVMPDPSEFEFFDDSA